MRQKVWAYSPHKRPDPKVSENVRLNLEKRAKKLIDTVLKPRHVKPPPENSTFNYVVDIYTKWRGHYFYFCSKYRSPGSNAISPFFELKFARMEYIENNSFNLSYMRHTGQWLEIFPELSMDQCLEAIKDEPFFYP